MSRGSVFQSLLAMVVGVALWCGGDVAGQESNPPPVNPPSSGNPFEDEGPKTEKAPAKKEPAAAKEEEKKDEEKKPVEEKKPEDEKKAEEEKKPEEEKVIREEVEPIVIPAPTPVKKDPAKPEVKEEDVKPAQPVPVKPKASKPMVVDEGAPVDLPAASPKNAPAVKGPGEKKPGEKQPVEVGKPVHSDEPMPEGAERPAPLAPHHKSVPANEAEIERSVYRAGDGTFHLAGEVGTAHYTGSDGKPCLAVLHLMGPSSPNPPFVLPAADTNYRYYYQEATCGDATVLAWAFQRPVCNSEGLWVMKYVRDAAGKKSWVVHGGAQRTAIGCLKQEGVKAGGTDCQPTYDPPAPGENLRPNPPAKEKKGQDDLPVSPEIRFEPQEVRQGPPQGGREIHFRAEE